MDGISSVVARIQQIESQFAPPPPPAAPGFDNALQQKLTEAASTAAPGLSGLPCFNAAMLQQAGGAAAQVSHQQIAAAAASMDGRQYWSNACAHAVNDALSSIGVNISGQVNGNPDWVPNYANLGQKIASAGDMQPGDLVIYNNYLGEGGYDHIGIYAGDGEAWNVSSANGHKWVKTPIGSRFQEGRRIASS